MDITCEFCQKIFQNNNCLKKHQKSAQYCLRLQKNNLEDDNCEILKNDFHITDIILNKHSEILLNNYNKIFDKLNKFEKYIENNIDKNNYIRILENDAKEKIKLLDEKEIENTKLKENIKKKIEERKKMSKIEIEIIENTKYKIKDDKEIVLQYTDNNYIDSTDLCLILGNDYVNWRKNKNVVKNIKMIAKINNIDEKLLIINTYNNKILFKYQSLFLLCELYSNELKFNMEKCIYEAEKNCEIKINIKKVPKTSFFGK